MQVPRRPRITWVSSDTVKSRYLRGPKRLRKKYLGVVVCGDDRVLVGGIWVAVVLSPRPTILHHYPQEDHDMWFTHKPKTFVLEGLNDLLTDWLASQAGKGFLWILPEVGVEGSELLLRKLRPKTLLFSPHWPESQDSQMWDIMDILRGQVRFLVECQSLHHLPPSKLRSGRVDLIISAEAPPDPPKA